MTKRNQLKILVLNGPNLNLLGTREPDIYGSETLADIERITSDCAARLGDSAGVAISVEFRQSNSESDLISWIGGTTGSFDGIVVNPAALTHTSVGLLDAISAVKGNAPGEGVPCVEVHLSNTQAREEFRHKSITAAGCIAQVSGFQSMSYVFALEGLVDYLLRA